MAFICHYDLIHARVCFVCFCFRPFRVPLSRRLPRFLGGLIHFIRAANPLPMVQFVTFSTFGIQIWTKESLCLVMFCATRMGLVLVNTIEAT
jgi:hypothetical protein